MISCMTPIPPKGSFGRLIWRADTTTDSLSNLVLVDITLCSNALSLDEFSKGEEVGKKSEKGGT